MKLIHKFKSPNFNDRKSSKINFIIIHYTALKSITDSIQFLCSENNKVSSHYLLSKTGTIYNLVSEKKRAWHAGQSYWKDYNDINSISIGIELDYHPTYKNNVFTKNLCSSLIFLLTALIKKYKIVPENILGHSDIAPYRKIDPGKFFPWHLLEEKNLAFKIKQLKEKKWIKCLITKWYIKNKFTSKKKITLFMLNYLGYDISLALVNNLEYNKLILNYSNRFRLYKNYKYNKDKIFNVIELNFFNIVLTKLKK